jgi:hypothetical protein
MREPTNPSTEEGRPDERNHSSPIVFTPQEFCQSIPEFGAEKKPPKFTVVATKVALSLEWPHEFEGILEVLKHVGEVVRVDRDLPFPAKCSLRR